MANENNLHLLPNCAEGQLRVKEMWLTEEIAPSAAFSPSWLSDFLSGGGSHPLPLEKCLEGLGGPNLPTGTLFLP